MKPGHRRSRGWQASWTRQDLGRFLVFGLTIAFSNAAGLPASKADPVVSDPQPEDLVAAKGFFKQGKRAYANQDFTAALDAFQQGYELSRLPGFLMNIGHCLRLLNRFSQASEAYREFILSEPEPHLRNEAAQWLQEMAVSDEPIDAPVVETVTVMQVSDKPEPTEVVVVPMPTFPKSSGSETIIKTASTKEADKTAIAGSDRTWLWIGAGTALTIAATIAVLVLSNQPSYESHGSLATIRQP